jgi:hypothetical protein
MTRLPLALTAAVLALGLLATAAYAAEPVQPTAEEIKKMEEAAADLAPQVKPAKPRRLLVFSVSWGYRHSAIDFGKAAIPIMGAKTGAFEAVVSDDLANFEPERLRTFDAVCFNNTNNELFLPENVDKLPAAEKEAALARDARLKESFAAYLSGGGGLAVIHAGVASFRQWPEFGNIIGARFTSHPWQKAELRLDDPAHPLAKAFAGKPLAVVDEIYQVEDPYSRQALRVLVSLDPAQTDLKAAGVKRTDADFGMTWIKEYGHGRVYYNAFGHRHELFWNPTILQHWLDGLQFVLGDLKVDTAPSAKAAK